MNGSGRPSVSSAVLFVSPWIRGVMYLVCAVPIAAVAWAFARQAVAPGSNLLVAAVVCAVVAVAFTWLFVRLYSLCSISVSTEGVAQSFLLHGGALKSQSSVPWDRIQRVSFSRLSYHFMVADGSKLELNTALFGDAQTTINAVRQFLPPRLLAQLDSPGS